MTTQVKLPKMPRVSDDFEFPDPPYNPEDKMTSFDHLTFTGCVHHLAMHLGNLDTTLVAGERYLSPNAPRSTSGLRYPDLLISFNASREMYRLRNGYVISEQGKPPDFVLEVASKTTGSIDANEKRSDYANLGIEEYWRFDETGQYHGSRLAGDRLVGRKYEPVEIEELGDDSLQGYSRVLNIHLRWEYGALNFYDPSTGHPIDTFVAERKARFAAEARADIEWERAETAEARVRELENQLRNQRPK